MINPMIQLKEVELVISYLNKNQTMLEFGCGGSTTIFPKYVKDYYSIEHNLDWYWRVQEELIEDKIENVNLHLCDIPKEVPTAKREFWKKYDENLLYFSEHLDTTIPSFEDCVYPEKRYVWHEYIDYVEKFGVSEFDIVFIDGRARVDCAYKVLNYIHDESIVFIHDFWPREQYHKVFDWYDEVVSIKETRVDMGQTIVGLKKK